jgi:type III secretory pathway component EscR
LTGGIVMILELVVELLRLSLFLSETIVIRKTDNYIIYSINDFATNNYDKFMDIMDVYSPYRSRLERLKKDSCKEYFANVMQDIKRFEQYHGNFNFKNFEKILINIDRNERNGKVACHKSHSIIILLSEE